MWEAALATGARVVSITSINEWGEGTQIEPAVPKVSAVCERVA
jgi:glycoprotein endo-alpha-1,2-mannosidase